MVILHGRIAHSGALSHDVCFVDIGLGWLCVVWFGWIGDVVFLTHLGDVVWSFML